MLSSFIVLTIVLRIAEPERESLGPHWLAPAIEVGLLLALVAANPAHLVGTRPVAASAVDLADRSACGRGAVLDRRPDQRPRAWQQGDRVGALAACLRGADRLGNALIFGLLYWILDSGGPLARYRHERPYPDFTFTQQGSEFAPPDWRPRYVDYFVLGISTSMAFSPTDVMPMTPWAKLTMTLQSVISLTVIGLVVARAVNAFT